MYRNDLVSALTDALLSEPWAAGMEAPKAPEGQRQFLRGLMNLRPPIPAAPALLALQDELLEAELREKEIVDAAALPPVALDSRLSLWRGDITTLRADAIVNAANSALLGCFHPCHGCIDNAIHSAAGIQLRLACHDLMKGRDGGEPPGQAKLTPGFHLPARYVLHTVGPVIDGPLAAEDRALLAGCYRACLALAAEHRLESVAFCCISTGVYRFPNEAAAEIAVAAVRDFVGAADTSVQKVVFNVFTAKDTAIYERLLNG